MRPVITWLGLVAVAIAILLAGCSSPPCEILCERNRECLQSGLDVEACARECSRRAERSRSDRQKIIQCAECMEETRCEDVVDACFRACT